MRYLHPGGATGDVAFELVAASRISLDLNRVVAERRDERAGNGRSLRSSHGGNRQKKRNEKLLCRHVAFRLRSGRDMIVRPRPEDGNVMFRQRSFILSAPPHRGTA